MRFGPVPLEQAVGAVLAHSATLRGGRLRKGCVLDATDVARMAADGWSDVIVARLEPGEIGENVAAEGLAMAMCGDGLEVRTAFTGRANLHALAPGVVEVDAGRIAAANAVDPMITVATLPEWQRVAAGTMAATVKIIAYGVDGAALARACDAARGAMRLHPARIWQAALIVTVLKGASTGAEAVVARLERFGVACSVREVSHEAEALAAALREAEAPLRLILTASATSDVADVGPAALARAGGRLIRFGMPVDPGNLLFLGEMPDGNGVARVIGLPGCARSPALNGADWVLEREVCGLRVTAEQIAEMGVGGLLKEIPTRPQPRERRR